MNGKTLATNFAWMAAGVLITSTVVFLKRPDADHSPPVAVAQVTRPLPAAAVQPEIARSSQVVPEPGRPAPLPQVRTVPLPQVSGTSKTVIEQAARYAESFQPGVFGEEGMPEFALSHLFPTKNAMTAAAEAEYTEIHKVPPDAWADEMNSRLRAFFSEQADLQNSHVSIGCRPSECQLQLVELKRPDDPPGIANSRLLSMLRRLYATPWFLQQFSGTGPGGTTPDDAAVRYMAIRLMRKT